MTSTALGRLTASVAAALAMASGLAGAALAQAPSGPAATPPSFALPVACEIGRTCFVQSFVDLDPGAGHVDHACGRATYDGHSGTDFRVPSIAAARAGVAVLAAAAGVVRGVRDDVADALVHEGGRAAITGRECGNGLVVDHGGGWVTQYCHLRQGSLRVRSGDRVAQGARLGDVGWSGLADFAHLHFEVRRDGKPVDPFTGGGQDGVCRRRDAATPVAAGLWDESASRTLAYRAGQVIEAGFAARPPTTADLEHGRDRAPEPTSDSDALVFFVRLINLSPGDRVKVRATGPAGFAVETMGAPVDGAKAVWIAYAGRKRRGGSWPTGRYEGSAELVRGEAVVATGGATLDMK